MVKREKLLALTAELDATGLFSEIFMISAETGDGVGDLMAAFTGRLPEGPWLFPEDQISDMPMRLIAAEVNREHLLRKLHDERTEEPRVGTACVRRGSSRGAPYH